MNSKLALLKNHDASHSVHAFPKELNAETYGTRTSRLWQQYQKSPPGQLREERAFQLLQDLKVNHSPLAYQRFRSHLIDTESDPHFLFRLKQSENSSNSFHITDQDQAKRFIQESLEFIFDYKTLLPFMAGAVLFRKSEVFALEKFLNQSPHFFNRGLNARILSSSFAFVLEVPFVSISSDCLHRSSHFPLPGKFADRLLSTAILLGGFRLGGALSSTLNLYPHKPMLRLLHHQMGIYGGIHLSQGIEYILGKKNSSEISAQKTFLHLIQLNFAGIFTQLALGKRHQDNQTHLERSILHHPTEFLFPESQMALSSTTHPSLSKTNPLIVFNEAQSAVFTQSNLSLEHANKLKSLYQSSRMSELVTHPRYETLWNRVRKGAQANDIDHIASSMNRNRDLAALMLRHNPGRLIEMEEGQVPSTEAGLGPFDFLFSHFERYFGLEAQFVKKAPNIHSNKNMEARVKALMPQKKKLNQIWEIEWIQIFSIWQEQLRSPFIEQYLLGLAGRKLKTSGEISKHVEYCRDSPEIMKKLSQAWAFFIGRLRFEILTLNFLEEHAVLYEALPERSQKDTLAVWRWMASVLDSINTDQTKFIRYSGIKDRAASNYEQKKAIAFLLRASLYYSGHRHNTNISESQGLLIAREHWPYLARAVHSGDLNPRQAQEALKKAFARIKAKDSDIQQSDLVVALKVAQSIAAGQLSPSPKSYSNLLLIFYASFWRSHPELLRQFVALSPRLWDVTEIDGIQIPQLNNHVAEKRDVQSWAEPIALTFLSTSSWDTNLAFTADLIFEAYHSNVELRKTPPRQAWKQFSAIMEKRQQIVRDYREVAEQWSQVIEQSKIMNRMPNQEEKDTIRNLRTSYSDLTLATASLVDRNLLNAQQLKNIERLRRSIDRYQEQYQLALEELDLRLNPPPPPKPAALSAEEIEFRKLECENLNNDLILIQLEMSSLPEDPHLGIQLKTTMEMLQDYIESGYLEYDLLQSVRRKTAYLEAVVDRKISRHSSTNDLDDPLEDLDFSGTQQQADFEELDFDSKMEWLRQKGVKVFHIEKGTNAPAIEYLSTLDTVDQNKILRTLSRLAQGIPLSNSHFQLEILGTKGIYKVKTRSGQRLFVFRKGPIYYLLNGYKKQSTWTPVSEQEKAQRFVQDISREDHL